MNVNILFVPSRLSFLSAEFDLSASTKNNASSPMLLSIQIEVFDEGTKDYSHTTQIKLFKRCVVLDGLCYYPHSLVADFVV